MANVKQEPSRPDPVTSQRFAGWWIWLLGLLIVGGAGVVFAWLAEDVWEKEVFSWDAPIMLAIHTYHAPWLDRVMIAITDIGLPGGFFVAAVAMLWLLYRNRWISALAIGVSFGGSLLITQGIKSIFVRERPLVFTPILSLQDYSFPSGHTMSALALYGFIAFLCWQQKRHGWAVLSIVFALFISFSRLYLGVHYPSDVLGALALGLAWVSMVILGYRFYSVRYRRRRPSQDLP
jgi:undecaprenyl-diphosphatase